MPEMPTNAAGWRIEPPVSVPVTLAPCLPRPPPPTRPSFRPGSKRHCRRRRAATARSPGRKRWSRSTSPSRIRPCSICRHAGAGVLQFARHGAFVGRLEALEDVRSGGRIDALGREQILDAERDARQRFERVGGARFVGGGGGSERQLGRFDGPRIERASGGNRGVEVAGDLARRKVAGAEAVAKLGDGLGRQGRSLFDHLRHGEETVLRVGRVEQDRVAHVRRR